jgi:hypothetical protein
MKRAVVAATACAALLAAACGSAQTASAGSPGPGQSSAPAGSPGPAASPGTTRGTLAAQYLTIARAGNRRLETDFNGLRDARQHDLATATADLRDAVATERLFDRRLLHLNLPPRIEAIARLLVSANQSRASLSGRAARSASLGQLRGYQTRLTAANAPVEEAVRVIRSMLGLPPPETS